jgi:hypothetical protein
MKNFKLLSATCLSLTLCLTGCETMGPSEKSGTLIGAATGAGLGAIAGNNIRGMNSWQGALAGAAVGGLVGNRMGAQKDEINTLRSERHTMVVYVRNYDGSRTPVMIRQIGPNSYQGPRGEIYSSFPTQSQLARRYGS